MHSRRMDDAGSNHWSWNWRIDTLPRVTTPNHCGDITVCSYSSRNWGRDLGAEQRNASVGTTRVRSSSTGTWLSTETWRHYTTSGGLLQTLEFAPYEREFGYSTVAIHRATLPDRFRDISPDDLHLGKRSTRVLVGASETIVSFDDGSTVQAPVIVGADGINSVIRQEVLFQAAKRDRGGRLDIAAWSRLSYLRTSVILGRAYGETDANLVLRTLGKVACIGI